MPTLAAYFDDSGTHPESTFAVIGGYLATPAQWIALAGPWQELLKRHGLRWFHMTDCEAGRKDYEHMSEPDRHELILDLAQLIDNNVRAGFRCALPKQVFDEQILAEARRNPVMKAQVKHAYAMGYRHVLHGLCLHCSSTNTSPGEVEIVFARQKKIGHAALDGARKQFTTAGFSEPVFREPRDYPALQAADMLAWMTYFELTKGRDAIQKRHVPLFMKASASFIDETILRWIGANLRFLHDAIEKRVSSSEASAGTDG